MTEQANRPLKEPYYPDGSNENASEVKNMNHVKPKFYDEDQLKKNDHNKKRTTNNHVYPVILKDESLLEPKLMTNDTSETVSEDSNSKMDTMEDVRRNFSMLWEDVPQPGDGDLNINDETISDTSGMPTDQLDDSTMEISLNTPGEQIVNNVVEHPDDQNVTTTPKISGHSITKKQSKRSLVIQEIEQSNDRVYLPDNDENLGMFDISDNTVSDLPMNNVNEISTEISEGTFPTRMTDDNSESRSGNIIANYFGNPSIFNATLPVLAAADVPKTSSPSESAKTTKRKKKHKPESNTEVVEKEVGVVQKSDSSVHVQKVKESVKKEAEAHKTKEKSSTEGKEHKVQESGNIEVNAPKEKESINTEANVHTVKECGSAEANVHSVKECGSAEANVHSVKECGSAEANVHRVKECSNIEANVHIVKECNNTETEAPKVKECSNTESDAHKVKESSKTEGSAHKIKDSSNNEANVTKVIINDTPKSESKRITSESSPKSSTRDIFRKIRKIVSRDSARSSHRQLPIETPKESKTPQNTENKEKTKDDSSGQSSKSDDHQMPGVVDSTTLPAKDKSKDLIKHVSNIPSKISKENLIAMHDPSKYVPESGPPDVIENVFDPVQLFKGAKSLVLGTPKSDQVMTVEKTSPNNPGSPISPTTPSVHSSIPAAFSKDLTEQFKNQVMKTDIEIGDDETTTEDFGAEVTEDFRAEVTEDLGTEIDEDVFTDSEDIQDNDEFQDLPQEDDDDDDTLDNEDESDEVKNPYDVD
ncbi:unnamed protein product [Chrysodeixis includens]|uniref:Uncharacterized protein n=1 Tax=Chrysodeixis includens TaxID=689277 RepID=A0A9N8L4V0_CHRIL|nr:unnamed protein product [Chrysodeixis includens]